MSFNFSIIRGEPVPTISLFSEPKQQMQELPQQFVDQFGKELASVLKLMDPIGNTHQIRYITSENRGYLFIGWREMRSFYKIVGRQPVLLKYRGDSVFDMNIFTANSEEIIYPIKSTIKTDGVDTLSFPARISPSASRSAPPTTDHRYRIKKIATSSAVQSAIVPFESHPISLTTYKATKSQLSLGSTFAAEILQFGKDPWKLTVDGKPPMECKLLTAENKQNYAKFGMGWKDFCKENQLKKNDNLVFQIVDPQERLIHVSINGTGLAAVFINISVENFAGWKFSLTFNIIQKSYFAGFIVYVLINLLLVYSSAFIVTQFAPAAAGSGIPEIKGYLNGVDIHGILLFRTLIGKIFGSIGSVGGGLALGKEGPLVHTGACIASLLGQGGSTKYHLNSRWFQVFKSDRDRRDLVTCGCAAGVAAAFRAPVGGVLFALEEVTSWWRSQLMWRVFFTSAIVAVVVRTAMGWCESGKCGHFGSGGFIIWDISDGQEDYSFAELLPMAIIGIIGGLLGALFNQLTLYITTWRRNHLHKKGSRVKIVEACFVSLLTSFISFGLPLLRSCSPCPESDPASGIECPRPPGMYGNYVNFFCSKDKEYNDLATIFFNTQDDAIRNLFSAKTINEYSSQSLLTFLVMFYGLAVVTFGTAVPAGQFVPGIMIGSTYGRLVGIFVVKYYRKLNIEEGTYALLGAASFLGGSMRMTVSLCVIMVEITNNLKLLPLIMLVLLISKAVGDAFNEGLYEEQARLRGIPLLESRPKYAMRNMKAKEACGSGRVVSFPRVVNVSDVVSILRSNEHNGFPVIDHTRSGEPLVIGLVLRSHLLVILQSKIDFQHSPLPSDARGGANSIRHDTGEFAKSVSSKGISIHDIHLSSDDLEMYIDLAPFLNPSPYIVPEDMSLTKVYNLFRQLGLRHLFVVPRPSRVLGLITRKDLLIEDTENMNALELRSTGVRIQPQNRRSATRTADVERPLLNGLLVPDQMPD